MWMHDYHSSRSLLMKAKIMKPLTFTSLAVLSLICAMFAGAQTNHVLTYTVASAPAAIVIRSGTILEFNGKLPEFGPTQFLSLQCRDQVRSSGLFDNSWMLRFDAAKEAQPTNPISIWQGQTSANRVRLAHVRVRRVETAPCTIQKPAEGDSIFGSTEIATVLHPK